MHFPVAGIDVHPMVPLSVSFVVSFFTSMGGVSGAFLLLPFQVSVLNYTAPSVSATNQVFNIFAIPSGVYRYIREGRMLWPLTRAVVAGTLPGVFIGAWVRVEYLPEPARFKLFAAFVLLYIGWRLAGDVMRNPVCSASDRFGSGQGAAPRITVTASSVRRVVFKFGEEAFSFSPPVVYAICFLVGIAGGVYGIGGGAIVAPFFVAVVGLPVYTVAGAALMGTLVTSVAGVAFYHLLSGWYPATSVSPDWWLGGLFGLGGMAGMYLGARCQKYVPARAIKILLCGCVLFVGGSYLIGSVWK